MRVTIIPEDQKVIIDGVAHEVSVQADQNIHAIQWDGEKGVIEYKRGGAKRIDDVSIIQPWLDVVQDAKVAAEAAAAQPREEPPKPLTVVDRIIADPAELAKLKTALGLI